MVTLATLPLKVGTVDNSGFIHYNESGVDKKLTVNDFLAKIASQYSTDINAFLASLSSIAGLDSLNKKGADIASATTTNLDTATGNYINITGTTTITGITLAEGKQRLVRFTDALILTNGANLVLPNASNITTAADDFALFVGDAGGVVRCVGYFRANTLATESTAGILPLASSSEAKAFTDDTKAITALKLSNAIGQIAIFEDQKASGTDGGTFTAGAWRTRTLNTSVLNNITGCSLGSDQITLPAGTYEVFGWAAADDVLDHKAKLRNITDSTDIIIGSNENITSATDIGSNSFFNGIFILAAQKVVAVQHYCSSTKATLGFGKACGFSVVELYCHIKLTKIA